MEVDSGHLREVDWDSGTLTITFRDGATYEYYDVPDGTYQELLMAGSKSQFFRQNIKGVFEFTKV